MIAVPVMGVAAGILTTVAGLGGGIILVLALSLVMEPAQALAITTPALLVGNAHRTWIYRARLDRRIAWRFVVGALPGSLLGGLVVGMLPGGLLRWVMLAMLLLAVVMGSRALRVRIPERFVTTGAATIGVLASAGGGAGLLCAPLLMGAGLGGETYLATAAASALTIHVGRILAYGATGLLPSSLLPICTALTAAVVLGNVLGRRIRRRLDDVTASRVELCTLLVSALLACAGLFVTRV